MIATGLHVHLTCAHCGAGLHPINEAHPTSLEATWIAQCAGCRRHWCLGLRLVPFADVDQVAAAERRRHARARHANQETRR